jgi:uncharacterized membrane protein YgcG
VTRARDFERFWVEFERPGRPDVEAAPPDPELAGSVATAVALRQHADAIPALDLEASWQALEARLEVEAAVPAATDPSVQGNGHHAHGSVIPFRPRPRPHWALRIAGTAVAAMIALAMVSLRATPGSALYPIRLTMERVAVAVDPRDRSIRLRVAEARLGDLLGSLRRGPVNAAPGLARSLVATRAAAGHAGADLADLDLRIALEVPPALGNAPPRISASVRAVLGSLLPPAETPGSSSGAGPSGSEGHHRGHDRGRGHLSDGAVGGRSDRHDGEGDHHEGAGGRDGNRGNEGGSQVDHQTDGGGGSDGGKDGGSSQSDSRGSSGAGAERFGN